MRNMGGRAGAALPALRAEVTDLRKFVVLNYVAVIKAVKKRNRHLTQVHPITRRFNVKSEQ